MTPVELFVLIVFFFLLIVFVFYPFFFYAAPYFALIYFVAFPLPLYVLNLLCYGIMGMILRRGAGPMKLADMDGLVPGYLALGQAILTISRFTRLLNDYASYDCSNTTQTSWYDWTP